MVVECSVAYLALSKGGCKIFGKRHSHKMIKFILIIYFHGTKYYQSIFLFLKNVRNIYYTYYTTLHYIIHNIYIYTIYKYIYICTNINIYVCIYRVIYIYIYIFICNTLRYRNNVSIFRNSF